MLPLLKVLNQVIDNYAAKHGIDSGQKMRIAKRLYTSLFFTRVKGAKDMPVSSKDKNYVVAYGIRGTVIRSMTRRAIRDGKKDAKETDRRLAPSLGKVAPIEAKLAGRQLALKKLSGFYYKRIVPQVLDRGQIALATLLGFTCSIINAPRLYPERITNYVAAGVKAQEGLDKKIAVGAKRFIESSLICSVKPLHVLVQGAALFLLTPRAVTKSTGERGRQYRTILSAINYVSTARLKREYQAAVAA